MLRKEINPFVNGTKIPTDEVFIAKKAEDLPGVVLAISKKEFCFSSDTRSKALEGLKELALRHLANALVGLSVVTETSEDGRLYLAKAKFGQIALPIPKGEPTPVGTHFERTMLRDPVPESLYFSILDTKGSALKPALNTFFSTIEEAKRSICAQIFTKIVA